MKYSPQYSSEYTLMVLNQLELKIQKVHREILSFCSRFDRFGRLFS